MGNTRRGLAIGAAVALLAVSAPAGAEEGRCPNGKSSNAAMWFSILHPGLGESWLLDWKPYGALPHKKLYLGFIPLYGWPGYLQVKSAIHAANCRTDDEIGWND